MKNKVIQASIGASVDFGDSADWLWVEHVVTNDAQLTAAFAHQNIAAGKKGHAERPVQSFGDDGYFYLVLLSGIEDEWTIAQGGAGEVDHICLTVKDGGKGHNTEEKICHRNTICNA